MKKLFIVLFFAIMLVGCNAANNDQPKKGVKENVNKNVNKEKEEQALAMQLLKTDEDNGVTLDEELYQQLYSMVKQILRLVLRTTSVCMQLIL